MINGNTLTVSSGGLGLPLTGILGEGRYYFLRMTQPAGYATGAVLSKNMPSPAGLVSNDSLPFISLTNTAVPQYVQAALLGPVIISGKDLTDGSSSSETITLAEKGQIITRDLTLTESRPTVVNVSPNDGATGVQTTTTVSVKFSRAMNANTVNTSTFTISDGTSNIDGTVMLLPDKTTAVFQPKVPFADGRLYRISLSTGIKDSFDKPLFGNQSDESFSSTFTTIDLTSPASPEAGQITMNPPVDGVAIISGTQGTVEPGVTVYVRNLTTNTIKSVIASDDGSFSIALPVGLKDIMELIIQDSEGNKTVMNIGRVMPPEGYKILGKDGGVVQGAGGTAVIIPAGLLPEDTIVSITPVDVSVIPTPFKPGLEGDIVGAVKFNMEGVEIADVMELQFSIRGYPEYTVIDRTPLFEVNRQITLPQDLSDGMKLIFRVTGRDKFGQRAELEAELPIVVVSPDRVPRTVQIKTTPVLMLTIPAQAAPGDTISVIAKAEPPDIKFRFPASQNLTGQEQFILFDVRESNGKTLYDLVTTAGLITLDDGTRVIESNTPPYRGPRRNIEKLVCAVFKNVFISFAAAVLPHSSGLSLSLGLTSGVGGFGASVMDMWSTNSGLMSGYDDAWFGSWLMLEYARPRAVDVSAGEFAVIPVPAGVPTSINIINARTNELLYEQAIDPIPPGLVSPPILLGAENNNPTVLETKFGRNPALPMGITLTLTFSHGIEPDTVTADTLYLLDALTNNPVPSTVGFADHILLLKPRVSLNPGADYTVVATTGIKSVFGIPLLAEFRFPFTTHPPPQEISFLQVNQAVAFDVFGDTALVAVNNGFTMADVSNSLAPTPTGTVQFDENQFGRVRDVKGMRNKAGIVSSVDGSLIRGPLAILSYGSPGVFSKIKFYSIPSLTPLSHKTVSTSTSMLIECGDLYVMDTGGMADIEVIDPCSFLRDSGIPKTIAIPTVLDTDEKETVYFINNGIGIMTIKIAETIPFRSKNEKAFGPSYQPVDKAGGIVVTPDFSIQIDNGQIKLTYPATDPFDAGSATTLNITGMIYPSSMLLIRDIMVNGFKANILPGGTTFSAVIPLHEGVNRVIATALKETGESLGSVGVQVLRSFGPGNHPLMGTGNVHISIPPLSTGGGFVSVGAWVDNRVKYDRIYINGELASSKICPRNELRPEYLDCGWDGIGSFNVPLGPGANSVVATAIDVDEYDPPILGYAELEVDEGLVLAIQTGGDLELFDASSLTRMPVPNLHLSGGFRVSVAKGVLTDIDQDGRVGLEENDDIDGITIFDELRNLALVGHGTRDGGKLTFVDITEPHNAEVIGEIGGLGSAYRGWADSEEGIAYLASGNKLFVIDMTHPNQWAMDTDGNGVDDRILRTVPLTHGGAVDVLLDKGKGVAYVLTKESGVAIIKLEEAQITGNLVNHPPVAADDSAFTLMMPASATIPVTANDSDPDGDAIAVNNIVTGPLHGTATIASGGKVLYKPDIGYCGRDTFAYNARDIYTNISNTADVQIVVSYTGLVINEIAPRGNWAEVCNRSINGVDVTGWTIAGVPLGLTVIAHGRCEIINLPGIDLSSGIIELVTDIGDVHDSVDMDLSCYSGNSSPTSSLGLGDCGVVSGNDCDDYRWISNPSPGRI